MEIVGIRWWELQVAWCLGLVLRIAETASGLKYLLGHLYLCLTRTFTRISLKSNRADLCLREIGLVWPWWFQIRRTIAGFIRPPPLLGTSTNVCTQDIYARILLKNQSWLTPYALDLFISAVNPCLVSIYASHCKRGPKLRCCLLKLHSIRNQLSYILAFFTECSCYFFTRIKYSFLMSVSFLGHLLKYRELQSWRMVSVFCFLYKIAWLVPSFFHHNERRFCPSGNSATWNDSLCLPYPHHLLSDSLVPHVNLKRGHSFTIILSNIESTIILAVFVRTFCLQAQKGKNLFTCTKDRMFLKNFYNWFHLTL